MIRVISKLNKSYLSVPIMQTRTSVNVRKLIHRKRRSFEMKTVINCNFERIRLKNNFDAPFKISSKLFRQKTFVRSSSGVEEK